MRQRCFQGRKAFAFQEIAVQGAAVHGSPLIAYGVEREEINAVGVDFQWWAASDSPRSRPRLKLLVRRENFPPNALRLLERWK